MLYILLIIIAIGVLLASKDGKKFLGLIVGLSVVGGLLYFGFWGIIFGVGLLSDRNVRNILVSFVGGGLLIWCVLNLIYRIYKGFKQVDDKIKGLLEELDMKDIEIRT